MTGAFVIVAARTLVGVILLASGVPKLMNRSTFAAIVRAFALVPVAAASPIATLVPIAEASAGIALLYAAAWPAAPARWAAAPAMALFVVFATAVAINLLRGRRHISCGCFGGAGTRIGWPLVWRNGVLCAASALGLAPIDATSAIVDGHRSLTAVLAVGSLLLAWKIGTVIKALFALRPGAESALST